MPHKDEPTRKAYHKGYATNLKADEKARRLTYVPTFATIAEGVWVEGISEHRFCLSCGGRADTKPHPDCLAAAHAARWKERKDQNNLYRQRRRAAAKAKGEVYRTTYKRKDNRRLAEARAEIRKRLGDKCRACPFGDFRALHIHHKKGGGNQHRQSTGWDYFRELQALPIDALKNEYELLCANCHAIETYNARQAAKEATKGLPAGVA
jgi:hypothetical protein